MMQFFEWYVPRDGHWKRYEAEVPRLASMGISACWIPREYSLELWEWDYADVQRRRREAARMSDACWLDTDTPK